MLTDCQGRALQMFASFLADPQARLARLTGFAGTGKSFLIRHLAGVADSIGLNVIILAPTGRAALRAREASGRHAATVHKWLYAPIEDPDSGETSFRPKPLPELEEDRGSLLIVDEASMISRKMWEHLSLAAAVVDLKVLMVGDPFQLEPVADFEEAPFAPLELPTGHAAHLDEVVRQALDSPVLRAATAIRQAITPMDVVKALGNLPTLSGKRTAVDVVVDSPGTAVICHRNVTRHQINNDVRKRRGLVPGGLEAGEPVMVLRNNYDVERYNGEIVTIENWTGEGVRDQAAVNRRTNEAALLKYRCGFLMGDYRIAEEPTTVYDIDTDIARLEGSRAGVCVCLDQVAGTLKLGEVAAEGGMRQGWRKGELGKGLLERPTFIHANYGYCLTAHKAQGSEWDSVLVVLENSIQTHDISGRRWTYTAITRAKLQCTWTYSW